MSEQHTDASNATTPTNSEAEPTPTSTPPAAGEAQPQPQQQPQPETSPEAPTTATSGTADGASQALASSDAAPSAASEAASEQTTTSVTTTSSTSNVAGGGGQSSATSRSHRGSNAGGSSSHRSHSDAASKRSPSATSQHSASSAASTAQATHSSRRKKIKLGELDIKNAKIGFLGAGKMADSTIKGLIHYAKISPSNIHVAAPSAKGLDRFKSMGCRVTRRNYDIFGKFDCDIIFLAFHGYVIKHCYKLGGNRPVPITTNYIPHQRHPIYILSLVSGVSLHEIRKCLLNPDSNDKYVYEMHRIMMNTAVGHGLGICAIDCEPDSKRLSAPIRTLLSSIAHLEHVQASQMDAACAIGGSGLAFSYYFINALADGAFKMGLSREMAIRFASKTAQCAAQTLLESGRHPAELRDTVSSPSGAAIYGIHVLDKAEVASGVTAAVEAAHKRANDLAQQDAN